MLHGKCLSMFWSRIWPNSIYLRVDSRRRGTPEGPSVQKFANLAEARGSGGLEIVFNQQ